MMLRSILTLAMVLGMGAWSQQAGAASWRTTWVANSPSASDAYWTIQRNMVNTCGEDRFVTEHRNWQLYDCWSSTLWYQEITPGHVPAHYTDDLPPGQAQYNQCVVRFYCR